MIHHIWIAFLHFIGADDTSGVWYGFWSGFCGDLFIVGAFSAWWHKHNCHEQKCWRIGKHAPDGTPYCTKHHPRLVVDKHNPISQNADVYER